MMKSEKEMIYFEEVDRIKVFRGVNKQFFEFVIDKSELIET